MEDLPLGKTTAVPSSYAPGVLRGVARARARSLAGIATPLPFSGTDVWNAWELTWLDNGGKPIVATATLRYDATSANIVESKSLKLYLNSLASTRFGGHDEVANTISRDLSAIVEDDVTIQIDRLPADPTPISTLPGVLLDDQEVGDFPCTPDAAVLKTVDTDVTDEALHSHLLYSLCPVTGQPDTGSLFIRYRGRRIDRASLLRYIVAYRTHTDFHEACVEKVFVDLKDRCRCERLTVYARYNRRGGLDINPIRTDHETTIDNPRLWRQ
ncbi:MAG: NADPH-dependent 7-cyano-7-deazaguanine reductase QueF [Pseudomonadota bacterium]